MALKQNRKNVAQCTVSIGKHAYTQQHATAPPHSYTHKLIARVTHKPSCS